MFLGMASIHCLISVPVGKAESDFRYFVVDGMRGVPYSVTVRPCSVSSTAESSR